MNSASNNYGHKDTSYKAARGFEGITKLCVDFYGFMDSLPEASKIRRMHPRDLSSSIEKLALFLSGWLGGPRRYQEKIGPINIPLFHKKFPIGQPEADAWILCMDKAIDMQEDFADDFKQYLKIQFRVPAERIRIVSESDPSD